jgi:hypothetical protein
MSRFLSTFALTAFREQFDRGSATVAGHPAPFDLRRSARVSTGFVQFLTNYLQTISIRRLTIIGTPINLLDFLKRKL